MPTNPPESPTAVLTTKEVAKLLGVAVRTVQLWVESGVLRAWKTAGGHRRIPRAAVDELLASRAGTLAMAPPTAPPAAAAATASFRVLVVEDDPALQLLFELTLGSLDLPLEVELADNGFAALLKMGEWTPDLLITDLNMPGMDGFAMIRHLRQSATWSRLPVVVVSALAARDIEARGGLPADIPRFGKPVPFEQLEQLIRDAAARRNGRPAGEPAAR
jgi:excisionase family DNA binding protein